MLVWELECFRISGDKKLNYYLYHGSKREQGTVVRYLGVNPCLISC